jgi:hypothetical protein
MKSTWLFTQRKKILIAAVCLFLSGCGSLIPYYDPNPTSGGGFIIRSDRIRRLSTGNTDLGFASYNLVFMEFVDEFGKKRNELTGNLQVVISEKPETSRGYTVYPGLSIYYYSYTIKIIRFGFDTQSWFTEIDVIQTGPINSSFRCANAYHNAMDTLCPLDSISMAVKTTRFPLPCDGNRSMEA